MKYNSSVRKMVGHTLMALCIFFVFQARSAGAAEESLGTSVFKFGGGIVSAFMIHEAAHQLAGWATGTRLDWKPGDINQPIEFEERSSSKGAGLAINAAGLVTQAIGAEVILQYDKIDKNDSYVRGMMFWNIINPITYVIDYWFLHRTNSSDATGYKGDLQGVEYYSDKKTSDVFAATLLATAAFQGYRIIKTQSWAPSWMKGDKLDKVGLVPLPSGGALMAYTSEF